jgi:hypothetical protein
MSSCYDSSGLIHIILASPIAVQGLILPLFFLIFCGYDEKLESKDIL